MNQFVRITKKNRFKRRFVRILDINVNT